MRGEPWEERERVSRRVECSGSAVRVCPHVVRPAALDSGRAGGDPHDLGAARCRPPPTPCTPRRYAGSSSSPCRQPRSPHAPAGWRAAQAGRSPLEGGGAGEPDGRAAGAARRRPLPLGGPAPRFGGPGGRTLRRRSGRRGVALQRLERRSLGRGLQPVRHSAGVHGRKSDGRAHGSAARESESGTPSDRTGHGGGKHTATAGRFWRREPEPPPGSRSTACIHSPSGGNLAGHPPRPVTRRAGRARIGRHRQGAGGLRNRRGLAIPIELTSLVEWRTGR
jgi:hypothetical protein